MKLFNKEQKRITEFNKDWEKYSLSFGMCFLEGGCFKYTYVVFFSFI